MQKIKQAFVLFLSVFSLSISVMNTYAMSDILIAQQKDGKKTTEIQKEVRVEKDGSFLKIDASALAEMLKKKDFIFINVHIPYEGEIEQTDLFIPYNEIEQNLDKLSRNKDTKIVLYCRTDWMSDIAALTLVELGYKNVWRLKGGMIEWEKAGYERLYKDR
jgi:rhodanese-related sulfurtransferase